MVHRKTIAVLLLFLAVSSVNIKPVTSQLETVLAGLAVQVGTALATKIITLVGEQLVKYAEYQITDGSVCGLGNKRCTCRQSYLTIANHNVDNSLQGPSMRFFPEKTVKHFGTFCEAPPGTIEAGEVGTIRVGNEDGTIGTGAEIDFYYTILKDGKATACGLKGYIFNGYLDDFNPFDKKKDPWSEYRLQPTPECKTLFPDLTVEKVAATTGTKGTGAYYMVYLDGSSAKPPPSPATANTTADASPSPSPAEKSPVVAPGPAKAEASSAFGDDFSSVAGDAASSPPPFSPPPSSARTVTGGSALLAVAASVALAWL